MTQLAAPGPVDPVGGRAGLPGWRYLGGWLLGWAIVGVVVAAAIAIGTRVDFGPTVGQSVLFAEVIGLSVLASTRLVFPLFTRYPSLLRIALQASTLFSGALFGSIAVFATRPLFSLANAQLVGTIVVVNSVLAVIVGTALHTYDSMQRQIAASFRLLREKEALDREMSIAREVQQGLLPRAAPEHPAAALTGICRPAVGVGGDYFDFLPFDNGDLAIVVADVSGKGIPAALLVSSVQSAVRTLATPAISTADVASRINRLLSRAKLDARYATFFFAVYEPGRRLLRYTNGGHHPPLLLRGERIERLEERGLPIGLFEETAYEEYSRRLEPGDLLALFTDGVSEAPNGAGEEFGEPRLERILLDRREAALDDLQSAVLDELARWTHGRAPHDDITLLLMRAR